MNLLPVLELARALHWSLGHFIEAAQRANQADRMVQAAALLMRSGLQRNEVRDALVARFQISRRSAYRAIERALNEGPR